MPDHQVRKPGEPFIFYETATDSYYYRVPKLWTRGPFPTFEAAKEDLNSRKC